MLIVYTLDSELVVGCLLGLKPEMLDGGRR